MSNQEHKIAEIENDPVSKLLGGLKRVEAPGDFDFRVKARIASGRPADRPVTWLPSTVRLAVPLGLLLVIGGYFGYNGLYPSNNNIAVVPIVEMQSALPIADIKTTETVVPPANEVIARIAHTEPASANNNSVTKPAEKRIVPAGPANREPDIRSRDIALGIPKPPLTPKDTDPNHKVLPKDVDKNVAVSAKEILSRIGAAVDPSWKVGSVKQNSMADRSGLKAGDVVEAIDGKSVTEKTTFENKSAGKSVRVRRGGTSIQIDLRP